MLGFNLSICQMLKLKPIEHMSNMLKLGLSNNAFITIFLLVGGNYFSEV